MLLVVLIVDALISISFGFLSYVSPESTFATIVDLRGVTNDSLIASALSSQSLFYVLIGLVALVSALVPAPHQHRLAFIMLIRHLWVGVIGFREMDRVWLVGDPWPDIIVHAFFVTAYAIGVALSVTRSRASEGPRR